MSVRMMHDAPSACAHTVAQLEERITVAKNQNSTMLLNLPRSIDELAATSRPSGVLHRLRDLFSA